MREELLHAMAEDFETPSYIFDLESLQERMEMIYRVFGTDISIYYAIKANPFLTKVIAPVVDGFEVCSPGEFRICERAGIPMEKIVLSGVYKDSQDIERILETYGGKGIYTAESLSQLRLLQEAAKKLQLVIKVLIRISSGNQFGCDRETVSSVIRSRDEYTNLVFTGFQYYSGTQKKHLEKVRDELHFLDDLIQRFYTEDGFVTHELEYGPGFFVPYFEKEQRVNDEAVMNEFLQLIRGMHYRGHITLEMGRYIAAGCGYYAVKIVDAKENDGQKYLIVDGGINHLNYYGQTLGMRIPHFLHLSEKRLEMEDRLAPWTVCGSLCTVGDVLVKNMPLRNPQVNDILIFENTGAYSSTESMYLFLSRDMPRIYFFEKDKGLRLMRDTVRTDELNFRP